MVHLGDRIDRSVYASFVPRAAAVTALARVARVSYQAVTEWTRVPPLRVRAVEQLTGIPRGELRPDLYPAEREQRGR